MIFEHPKEKNMDTKIKYCLESFGVSDRARNSYAGTTDLDAGEMIGSGAPPPIYRELAVAAGPFGVGDQFTPPAAIEARLGHSHCLPHLV